MWTIKIHTLLSVNLRYLIYLKNLNYLSKPKKRIQEDLGEK